MGGHKEIKPMHYIGKIDIHIYQRVTAKSIITDEVVLTDNRKDHIIKRRGQDFYDKYKHYFPQIISEPDYLFKDEHENSVVACKTFSENGPSVNLVIRLAVEDDDILFKNSIITAIKESEKRFAQRLRNNVPIYKRIDKQE